MDIVGSGLLFISEKGITTYSLEDRCKIGKSLKFTGYSGYNIAKWATSSSIVYGAKKNGAKMKLMYTKLNITKSA